MRISTCVICVLLGVSMAEVVRSATANGATLPVRAEALTIC